MSVLLTILIIIVVLALVMWAIYYVPLPPGSPTWLKNFLYILVLIVAIIVIVYHTGALRY
jgi:hypothetical protein